MSTLSKKLLTVLNLDTGSGELLKHHRNPTTTKLDYVY